MTTTQPQQTSSLFGNVSQPQQTGGLFGSLGQTGNTQQQQAASGSGLFGSVTQSKPQQTGGLFGSLGQTQTQAQQPQNSLFGGINNQNKAPLALYVVAIQASNHHTLIFKTDCSTAEAYKLQPKIRVSPANQLHHPFSLAR